MDGRRRVASVLTLLLLIASEARSRTLQCHVAKVAERSELSVALSAIGASSVPSNLLPTTFIHVGGCVSLLTQGWWSYEFCPGKWIRQHHSVQNKILSEYFLGFGPHALDDDVVGRQLLQYDGFAKSPKEKIAKEFPSLSSRSWRHRAGCSPPSPDGEVLVSVEYRHGTICDATNKPRTTEVVYVCRRGENMWNITETKACEYKVFFVGPIACRIQDAGLPSTTKAPAESTAKAPAAPVRPPNHIAGKRKLTDLADAAKPERAPGASEQPATPPTASAPLAQATSVERVEETSAPDTAVAAQKVWEYEEEMIFSV